MLLLLVPDVADAQFVPCGSDGQPQCSFCHFVVLGQNVLNWLFGIVFVIFGVVAVAAGFGLVTSGGNQAKLDDAKKKLSNAFIGLLIVFSAWLIVDTLLKASLGGNGEVDVGGIGMWNEIDCSTGGQREPIGVSRELCNSNGDGTQTCRRYTTGNIPGWDCERRGGPDDDYTHLCTQTRPESNEESLEDGPGRQWVATGDRYPVRSCFYENPENGQCLSFNWIDEPIEQLFIRGVPQTTGRYCSERNDSGGCVSYGSLSL